jgi:outer membrane protein assembly factor BamB
METIAVIPIFVNASAAALPTIMAAAVSVVMVVFRPRELIRLLGRRPAAFGVSAAVITIGLGVAIWRLTSVVRATHASPLPARQGRIAATVHFDWAKVAQELIAQQKVRQERVPNRDASRLGAQIQAAPTRSPVAERPFGPGAGAIGSTEQASREESTKHQFRISKFGFRTFWDAASAPQPEGPPGRAAALRAEGIRRSVSVSQAERDSSCGSTATGSGPHRLCFAGGIPSRPRSGRGQALRGNDAPAEAGVAAKLTPLWRFWPEDTMFLGTPAVVGNRIFAAGCPTDLGGYTGLLACLDSQTGKPLWQVAEIKGEPLRPFFSSPAVTADGRYLVIGQGLHQDRDCSLLCFDAATGQLRWAVKTPLHIESSPAVFGDVAVVGAGAVEGRDGRPVGDPGYCLAVRISDGKELWRQPVNDPESSPAIDENCIVYIGSGFNGNAVVAIRSESDEQLRAKNLERVAWRTSVAQPIPGPIVLAGDVVVAGGGNSDLVHSNRNARGLVVALDRRTGAILWQTQFDDAVLGAIACSTDMLFCPVRTGEVVALAMKDGRILWRTRVSGNAPVLGGCVLAGPRVYAVSSDGYLAVLDVKEGRVLDKTYLNDQAKPGAGLTLSTPRVTGRRVAVGSETGGLRCLLESGGTE